MTSLTLSQAQFIDSVLSLEPRVAAFDCDGTLWSGDAGEGFFSWELEEGVVSEDIRQWARSRYTDYRAGKVPEDVMCGEMVTMHHGMRDETLQKAADTWFPQSMPPNFFPEMVELVQRLRRAGCDVWAVSSTNQWVIRAGMRYFGIAPDHILAAEAAVENGVILDRVLRMPSGPGKPDALRQAILGDLTCAFGNSIWDREMLEMAQHPFAINPKPNLKEIALKNGWKLYQPKLNHRRLGTR
jgi:phosphoserine phosphatase